MQGLEMSKEELNHQAYNDVMELAGATMLENEYYMQCYGFWMNVDPQRKYGDY